METLTVEICRSLTSDLSSLFATISTMNVAKVSTKARNVKKEAQNDAGRLKWPIRAMINERNVKQTAGMKRAA